jgi:DNA repair photolyase
MSIRLDTYDGCEHRCSYCFVQRNPKKRAGKMFRGRVIESAYDSVARWIAGKRDVQTRWCDWRLPLHWGGTSDPFQPYEVEAGMSLRVMRLLGANEYPYVISTKGTGVLTRPEYLDALATGLCSVVQVSMVEPGYDKLETGAPSYAERLAALPVIREHCLKLVVRLQPYFLGRSRQVCECLPRLRDAGVDAVTIEGFRSPFERPHMVRSGNTFFYPAGALRTDFLAIQATCQRVGLQFGCADNALRHLSEDPCCCMVSGVPGFRLNWAVVCITDREYSPGQCLPGTALALRAECQNSLGYDVLRNMTYRDAIERMCGAKSEPHEEVPCVQVDQPPPVREALGAHLVPSSPVSPARLPVGAGDSLGPRMPGRPSHKPGRPGIISDGVLV